MVFVLGLLLLAFSGGPVSSLWPMWRTFVWVPLVPPVVYLAVNLAYPQPASFILKVVLLHTFIILQVRNREGVWRYDVIMT